MAPRRANKKIRALIFTVFKFLTSLLLFRGQYPAKDVADELRMQPGAVRVAKSRVLNRLRHELGDLPLAEVGVLREKS